MATPYVPGMGTHHIRGGITPATLANPNFDRNNPDLAAAGLDGTFDPTKPEVLQFDGNGPDAKLVGFDYYVRSDTGRPPVGFAGNGMMPCISGGTAIHNSNDACHTMPMS